MTGFNFDITFVEGTTIENLRAMMKTLLTKSESKSTMRVANTVYAGKKHQNLPDDEDDYEEMDTYYSSDEDEEQDEDTKEPKLENLDDLDDDDDVYDDDDDF